jgi:DNA-binding CsgD family transcriptional regulator
MQHWVLPRGAAARASIDCARAARLIEAVGDPDPPALARGLLATVRHHFAVHHCTVFAYPVDAAPMMVSGASADGSRCTVPAGDAYVRRFWSMDGNRGIVSRATRGAAATVVVHRMAADEIADPEYRHICYAANGIGDRLCVLSAAGPQLWLGVSLYRNRSHGAFSAGETGVFHGLAPLLAQAATRHHGLLPRRGSAAERLRAAQPALSAREVQVLALLADGLTVDGVAAELGIKPTSVVTYRNRGYQRLGIRTRRELFARMLA